jgi:hypothetical protein
VKYNTRTVVILYDFLANLILVLTGELSTKKGGDVIRFGRMGGSEGQFFMDGFEVTLTSKEDIGLVFYLRNAPVKAAFKMTDDWTEPVRNPTRIIMKVDLIGQRLLSFIPVRYEGL